MYTHPKALCVSVLAYFLRKTYTHMKEGEKIKTKPLTIRLPSEHWIWEEKNKRKTIEDALKQYRETSNQHNKVLAELTALRKIMENGKISYSAPKKGGRDSRLKAEAFIDI